ncbi:MAG TPA: phosphatase PAP2 family protein [Blastococcus sp.]|nr:phosphatase PAP2 family protein [Blastococcus sp.]
MLAAVLTVFYVALTGAVLTGSDVDGMDTIVLRWSAAGPWPWLHEAATWWVLLGQRGICLAIAVVLLVVRALWRRDLRPLITLGVVTLLLNVSVGIVKLAVGRLGPLQLGARAVDIGASQVFTDGTVFPSGHTANAVVTWGLLALLARRHRRIWGVVSGLLAVSIGLTTIYLGTHWVSDVAAGLAAGCLVLLAVPSLTPVVDRLERVAVRLLPGHRYVVRGNVAGDGDGPSGAAVRGGMSAQQDADDPSDGPTGRRLHRRAARVAAGDLPAGARTRPRGRSRRPRDDHADGAALFRARRDRLRAAGCEGPRRRLPLRRRPRP